MPQPTPPLTRRDLLAWAGATTLASAAGSAAAAPAAPLPQVATGRIERLQLSSRHVDPRPVDVWLPNDHRPDRPCRVLYMHDGQTLYDASTTWNRQAWDVHLSVDRLRRAGQLDDTLVVGVWNNGPLRHSEYFPQKFLPFVPEPLRQAYVQQALAGQPRSDAYLRFLVEELKPAIDARYGTRPGRADTFIAGSSMGGLISVYAMNEYPEVFGGAAGLSTHWVGLGQPNAHLPLAAFQYLQRHLADPATHRLYMDHGTTELDAIYAPYQAFVNELVRDRGYTAANARSLVLPGTGHNERAWAARLDDVLPFLMPRRG
ncbi:MAG: alpha/beta hydrolase [Rubrivivax sp.]